MQFCRMMSLLAGWRASAIIISADIEIFALDKMIQHFLGGPVQNRAVHPALGAGLRPIRKVRTKAGELWGSSGAGFS
jgi:hypothetical protein